MAWPDVTVTPGHCRRSGSDAMSDPKPRILLVDDAPEIRFLLRKAFERSEVQLFEAANGMEAVRLLPEVAPDLVLTDMEMPQLDGLGLIEAIRRTPRLTRTPVVVMSGDTTDRRIDKALEAGGTVMLPKPFTRADLWLALERAGLPGFPAAGAAGAATGAATGASRDATGRNVSGILFADYVRMLRMAKGIAWREHLAPADARWLVETIDPSSWYSMETFERLGNAILEHVAHGDMTAARMWGRISVDPLAAANPSLVEP